MSVKTSTFVAAVSTTPISPWDGLGHTRTNRGDHRDPDSDDYDQIVAEVVGIQNDIINNRFFKLVNDNAGALVCGTPVYMKSNGHVDKAQANGAGTRMVLGIVADASIASGATGRVQVKDAVILTTAQWDAIAGTSGGLTAGTLYYLSDTVGLLTATAPAVTGDDDFRVGIAISNTQLFLRLDFEKTHP